MKAGDARVTAEKQVEALWLSLLDDLQKAAAEGKFRLHYSLPKVYRDRCIPWNFMRRLRELGYEVHLKMSKVPFSITATGLDIYWPGGI